MSMDPKITNGQPEDIVQNTTNSINFAFTYGGEVIVSEEDDYEDEEYYEDEEDPFAEEDDFKTTYELDEEERLARKIDGDRFDDWNDMCDLL